MKPLQPKYTNNSMNSSKFLKDKLILNNACLLKLNKLQKSWLNATCGKKTYLLLRIKLFLTLLLINSGQTTLHTTTQ